MRRFSTGILALALLSTWASSVNATGIDAPEISRSRGVKGSVVVLWPRIIPADGGSETNQLARGVQDRLVALVRATFPGREIDVRPAPERVCPMGGCEGAAVGALLLRRGDGCAVVALVSQPGTVPMSLVPWAGDVRLRATRIPFRQHPENWVTVTDFAPCDQTLAGLEANEAVLIEAIRKLDR